MLMLDVMINVKCYVNVKCPNDRWHFTNDNWTIFIVALKNRNELEFNSTYI